MLSKRCYNKNSYQMGNRWRGKMNNKLRFLDLFAGIGGFRSGMEKEGHECVGYVEWDKHARKSYENMYDTKGEWTRNDITEITNDEWKELRGKVDITAEVSHVKHLASLENEEGSQTLEGHCSLKLQ